MISLGRHYDINKIIAGAQYHRRFCCRNDGVYVQLQLSKLPKSSERKMLILQLEQIKDQPDEKS